MKIAIQGINGSFHQQVANLYFGNYIEIQECVTFKDAVKQVSKSDANKAVIAIENSIAGSIIPNYALIDDKGLKIVGEYYLKISLNLMALKGQKIEDIKEVHSHPIALLQCAKFFEKHSHIKLIESSDTAITAKKINQQQLKGIAALAGPTAAELYELEIISSNIQAVESNITRFVILEKEEIKICETKINKASIKFELDDTPGSLATILNVMNNCKLNLTKIQSMPIIETPFQYSFFVDVVFNKYKHFEKAKKILELMTTHFKVLGEYESASSKTSSKTKNSLVLHTS